MTYDPNFPQYPGPYSAPQYIPPAQPVNPEKNGFGITACILGPIAILLAIMPITGWLAVIVAFTGLVLGLAGLSRVRKNKASNKGTTITGVILSVLGLFFGIVSTVIFFSIMNDLGNDLDQIGNDMSTYSDCISAADTAAEMDACK